MRGTRYQNNKKLINVKLLLSQYKNKGIQTKNHEFSKSFLLKKNTHAYKNGIQEEAVVYVVT